MRGVDQNLLGSLFEYMSEGIKKGPQFDAVAFFAMTSWLWTSFGIEKSGVTKFGHSEQTEEV